MACSSLEFLRQERKKEHPDFEGLDTFRALRFSTQTEMSLTTQSDLDTVGKNAMPTPSEISKAAALMGAIGGRKGGASTTPKKIAASRRNGAKGGRPKGSGSTVDQG